MATKRQIEANRENSNKSTGPKTDEGRAKSSRNRLSWGFCSSTILMPGEDPREFEGLLEDLTAHHQPANVIEQILVEKMAQSQWLSLRAFRLQGECFTTHHFGPEKCPLPSDLPVLIRYRTTADNAFLKHLKELLSLQKQRQNSEIGFEPQSFGQEVPEEAPQQPKAAPPVPISANSSPRGRDLVFTDEEMNFDLCPESLEFIKKVG
jgi:hypothetical protein